MIQGRDYGDETDTVETRIGRGVAAVMPVAPYCATCGDAMWFVGRPLSPPTLKPEECVCGGCRVTRMVPRWIPIRGPEDHRL
jgi:hypothetical protein